MLTLDRERIGHLLATGDTRWIHRAAYDLMGYAPDAPASSAGMPRGRSLYGTLPEQLKDETSFVSRLRRILSIRETYEIALADQVDVPAVSHRGVLVMVHLLPDGRHQVSVLNFSPEEVPAQVISEHLPPGAALTDMITGDDLGVVNELHGFTVDLAAHDGVSVLVTAPAEAGPDDAHGSTATAPAGATQGTEVRL